jgi:hypothetical protein
MVSKRLLVLAGLALVVAAGGYSYFNTQPQFSADSPGTKAKTDQVSYIWGRINLKDGEKQQDFKGMIYLSNGSGLEGTEVEADGNYVLPTYIVGKGTVKFYDPDNDRWYETTSEKSAAVYIDTKEQNINRNFTVRLRASNTEPDDL